MRIGIFGGDISGPRSTVHHATEAAQRAASDGFASFWLSQIFGLDALTALSAIATQVPEIELGTAVVPSYPRHPIALAQQALTVQSASKGRLTLGIGLSHKMVIEGVFGLSFDKPVSHMREYLEALTPALRRQTVAVTGENISANVTLEFPDATPPGLLLAALGENMLGLAAEYADGTITWMTGPKTLAEHTIPTLTAAAGGTPQRVVAALPVAVTDDVSGAKARAAEVFKVYGVLPSYRNMLDREGAKGPEDIALVGDPSSVAASIRALGDIGVTDFVATEFVGGDDAKRTREMLQSLL